MSGYEYGSVTTYQNNDIVAVRNNRVDIDLELGQMRETGRTAFVQSTYASRYNHAARQYNYLADDDDVRKRNMRGGHLFLYNIIAFILFGASITCYIMSPENKPLIAAPIVISTIYLLITCYNWHIYRTNGSLVHELMFQVPDHYLPGTKNKHFTIPLNANVQSRELLAATDGDTTAIIARLRQRYVNLTEIDVMFFDSNYAKYFSFPLESLIHFLFFLGALIVSIMRVLSFLKILT